MKRRAWIVAAVAATPVSIAASQPKQDAQGQQRQAERQVVKAAPPIVPVRAIKPVGRAKYKPPCLEPQDQNRCDLEAQWKAANAAEDTVWWAKIQTMLSAFGVVGLILSLLYTRKAVRAADAATVDAEESRKLAARNADAVIDANEIARKSFEASNRPWVFVSDVKIVAKTYQRVDAHVIYKNFGNWPAINFAKRSDAITEPYPFYARAIDEPDASLATVLPPGESEGTVIKDFDFRPGGNGYKTRILINTSYQLPSGAVVRDHTAFVVEVEDGKVVARKFVGYDSANHPDHAQREGDA